jgi:hypothetical protein
MRGAYLPISAVDAIGPAFEHTRQQLLKPFRLNQWGKLALVGFLTGELSSGGGCSMPSIPRIPHSRGDSHLFAPFEGLNLPHWDPKTVGLAVTLSLVGILVLGLLFVYLNSVMRFVLFDSVIDKQCEIGRSWRRRHDAGMRFFFWQISLVLISWGIILVLIGIPALIGLGLGWFSNPGDHMLPLILGGIFAFVFFFLLMVVTMVVTVLTKDFVVPQMALENIGAVEGWRRLLPMMKAERGGYAGYIGMKIVLALGAAILFGIVSAIAILFMLIPAAAMGGVALLAGKAAGMTWTLYTITAAVVAGSIAILVMLYVVSFVSVPGIVFFPAYSLYFFAARYPALSAVLYPPLPAPPPPVLPPFLPPPEPIG